MPEDVTAPAQPNTDATTVADEGIATAGFLAARRAASIAALDGAPKPARAPDVTTDPATPGASPDPAAPAGAKPADTNPSPVEPDKDDPAITALRKQEIHLKRQIQEEREKARAEIEAERRAFYAERDALEPTRAALANAKRDRLAAIKALGFQETEFASLGTELYANSPEGAKDPRYKAQADQAAQRRAEREELTPLQKDIAELKAWRQEQAEQAAAARDRQDVEAYVDSIAADATEATPIAKIALAKGGPAARKAIADLALEMYIASGPAEDLREAPSNAAVLKEYDRRRAAELAIYGLDTSTIGRPAPAPAPPRPAATLAPAGGSPTPVKPSGRMSRDDLVAEVDRMTRART